MQNTLLLLLVLWSSTAMAKVINFEIKFTPFIGDPATADHVQTVSGKARVFLNNVSIAEQDVSAHDEPVLFDEREVGAAVWVPVASVGPSVRKGKNTLRIEFEPADNKTDFRAQLSWAEVNDQSNEQSDEGSFKSTNQSGEGKEIKETQGKVVMEKDFVADFAADLPWHHYQPVNALSDADKQQLLTLVNDRAALFQPKFEGVYKFLEIPRPGIEIDLAQMRKEGCLNKAYAAGVRVAARSAADVDFILSGIQEVVIKGQPGNLYPFNEQDFAKIKGDEAQMCAGMAMSIVYPSQLVVVKNTSGMWEVVY